MRSTIVISLMPAFALATLDPATSNTQSKVPSKTNCDATKMSTDIQAAECAYNTRTHDTETFAVWMRSKTNSNGISYGTCEAYTCIVPTSDELVANADGWTFFWGESNNGEEQGPGTDCIKDPNTTECGCENSDGEFIVGSDSCT